MKGHITDKKKKSEKKGAVKRIFLGALLIGIGALILGGCGSSTEETQSEQEKTASAKKEDDKIQIGLTVDSFVIERWIRDRDVFVATAREMGADVNVQDAGADAKEQIIKEIRGLRDKNYVQVLYKVYVQYKTVKQASKEMKKCYNYTVELHNKALAAFEKTYQNLHYLM